MESVTIQTSQNVSIDYPLAGTGARIGSFFIDVVIFIVVYWIFSLLMLQLVNSFADFSIILFGSYFCFLAYYFFLEMFSRGQTLGKRIIGLRVIRLDGRDPTPADFLTRAVFLLPDILLTGGIPAIVLIFTGRQNQRLGDIVAGTAVIQSAVASTFSLEEIMGITNREDHEPEFPGVQQFTNDDMMIVKHSLERMRKYGNSAHRQAVRQLAVRIADQLELNAAEVKYSPEKFLEVVLLDYIVLTR